MIEVDLLGNLLLRGPGEVVGVVSIFLGEQMKTTITHTYVQVVWVDLTLYIGALRKAPKIKRIMEIWVDGIRNNFMAIRQVYS